MPATPEDIMPEPASASVTSNNGLPTVYGMNLFPGFQALDVFGALGASASSPPSNSSFPSLISSTLDPVSTAPPIASGNPWAPYSARVWSLHTPLLQPPILVSSPSPGVSVPAFLARPSTSSVYSSRRYPTLKYFITICTGSAIAAQTGVLDGKKATTNKAAWKWVTAQGPDVDWVPKTRWTVDGNVWTSSGAAAGIDAFLEMVYGLEAVEKIVALIEYERHLDPAWDPWADKYNTA